MAELKTMTKDCVTIGAAIGLLALGLVLVPAGTAVAASPRQSTVGVPTDLSAQTTRRPRARTRVYVTPNRRQPAAWDYPRPGDVSWPGPGALRDCTFRLEQEFRPSGTVIVPRQSCWWVRG